MPRFEGKGALVTGGTSGIGKAAAARLAVEGARVLIAGRDPDRLAAALAELAPLGDVYGLTADVADPESVTQLLVDAEAQLDRLDVLVHSAGIDGAGADVLDIDLSAWQRALDINLTGAFLVAQAAARRMAATGGGSIVLVASLNGLAAERRFADYNASKGGLLMLARSLAVDLVDRGIRVNAVCPGYILTPMTEGYAADPDAAAAIRAAIPMGRFGDPAEVAGAIAFLASADASYITGEALIVDGGRRAQQ